MLRGIYIRYILCCVKEKTVLYSICMCTNACCMIYACVVYTNVHREGKGLWNSISYPFDAVSRWAWRYFVASKSWWSSCLHRRYRFMWSHDLPAFYFSSGILKLKAQCLWRKCSYPLSHLPSPSSQLLNKCMHIVVVNPLLEGAGWLVPYWQRLPTLSTWKYLCVLVINPSLFSSHWLTFVLVFWPLIS